MPVRPKKPCAYPGCKNLVKPTQRYCELHLKQINRDYNERRRDMQVQEIYNSARWKKVRGLVMRRDGGLCQQCKREGRITPADVVDHIVEIKDGGCVYCEDNLEALCHNCHNKKTAKVREGRV